MFNGIDSCVSRLRVYAPHGGRNQCEYAAFWFVGLFAVLACCLVGSLACWFFVLLACWCGGSCAPALPVMFCGVATLSLCFAVATGCSALSKRCSLVLRGVQWCSAVSCGAPLSSLRSTTVAWRHEGRAIGFDTHFVRSEGQHQLWLAKGRPASVIYRG